MNFTKKISKKVKILAYSMVFIISLFLLLSFNLEKIIEKTVGIFLEPEIKVENIEMSLNKISIEKLELLDKNKDVLLEVPDINIFYSWDSIKNKSLEKVSVANPKLFVKRDKNGDFNLKELFSKKEKIKKNKVKEEKTVKDKEARKYRPNFLPVREVYVNNLELNLRDEKFTKIIEKKIENIDIKVQSNREKGIYAEVLSEKSKEKFKIIFKNEMEPYSILIKSEGFILDEYVGQYISDSSNIKYLGGELKTDILISPSEKQGYIKFENGNIEHSELEDGLKNINLNLNLKGKDGDLVLLFDALGEKNRIDAVYKNGEFNSVLLFENIDYKKLNKIKFIKNSNLNLDKIDINKMLLSLNYSSEQGLIANYRLIPNILEINHIKIEDILINLIIKDGIKKIDNSKIVYKVIDVEQKLNIFAENDKNILKIKVNTENLDKNTDILPELSLESTSDISDNFIKSDININGLILKMDYDRQKKDIKFYNDEFYIEKLKENDALKGQGLLSFSLYELNNILDFKIEDNIFEIKNLDIKDEKKSLISLNGKYNFLNKNMNFDYKSENFSLKRKYKNKDIDISFKAFGSFENKNGNLSGSGELSYLNFLYDLIEVKGIKGKYSIYFLGKNKNIDFNGKTDKIFYKNYSLKDIDLKLKYKNENLIVSKIGNEEILLNGIISPKSNKNKIDLTVRELSSKTLGIEKPLFDIKDLKAQLIGELRNPKGYIDINDVSIKTLDYESNINGKIRLEDKKINIPNINVNDSSLKAFYNIDTQNYNAELKINENLDKYLKGKNLDYTLKGEVKVKGKSGNIDLDSLIIGEGNLEDRKLPSLVLNSSYKADEYSNGIFNLKNLSLNDNLGKTLLLWKGYINLKNKDISISSNDNIELQRLKDYFKLEDKVKGNILIKSNISGTLDKISYLLDVNSKNLSIKNNNLDELKILVEGDNKKINLNKFIISYLENQLIGQGFYDIKNRDYNFDLQSNLIELKKINTKLNESKIKDISGTAQLKLHLNNVGLNGFLKTDNVNLNLDKENIILKDFNSFIDIKDNKVDFKKFSAKLNDGNINLNAYIRLPKNLKNISQNLDYAFNFNLKDFNYNKKDVAKMILNSRIQGNNKKISGEILIDEAIIYDIPNDYKSIWSILKKHILKKEKKKKEVKSKNNKNGKSNKILERLESVDLKLRTVKPIKLDIDDFNIIVGEVKGELETDLEITGKKGKFYILGNTEILNGYVNVNTNKFILERALISFNDTKTYIPSVNPDIFLETRVNMDGDDLNLNINGKMKKLIYSLSSEKGSEIGNLSSLLQSNDSSSFLWESNGNKLFVKFMKNIIAGQAVDIVFGRITKATKKVLNLSKLTLKPEIVIYDANGRTIDKDKSDRSLQIYDIGAKLEIEKNLYREKLFAYSSAKINGTNKKSNIQTTEQKIGIKEYDVGLEYRTRDGKSIGVGVGTAPDRYGYENENYKRRNYHIDFKIRKKYNNFLEIFPF